MDSLDTGWLQTFNLFLKTALCAECSRMKHNETKCNEMRRACGCTDTEILRTHSRVIQGKAQSLRNPYESLMCSPSPRGPHGSPLLSAKAMYQGVCAMFLPGEAH